MFSLLRDQRKHGETDNRPGTHRAICLTRRVKRSLASEGRGWRRMRGESMLMRVHEWNLLAGWDRSRNLRRIRERWNNVCVGCERASERSLSKQQVDARRRRRKKKKSLLSSSVSLRGAKSCWRLAPSRLERPPHVQPGGRRTDGRGRRQEREPPPPTDALAAVTHPGKGIHSHLRFHSIRNWHRMFTF